MTDVSVQIINFRDQVLEGVLKDESMLEGILKDESMLEGILKDESMLEGCPILGKGRGVYFNKVLSMLEALCSLFYRLVFIGKGEKEHQFHIDK